MASDLPPTAPDATRRALLIGVAGVVGIAACGSLAGRGTARAEATATRPYSIDDYLRREEVSAIVPDATGSQYAILLRRNLLADGPQGMRDFTIISRCDVWLSDSRFTRFDKITTGQDWFSNPVFSPDGRSIAMLRVDLVGNVGLGVRRRDASRVSPVAAGLRVESTACLAWSNVLAHPIVWLDDRSVLVVEKVGDYLPRPIIDLRNAQMRADWAARSRRGDLSVRSWRTEDRETCSAANSLMRVDVVTGSQQRLFQGDVRGAAVSPDGRHVAVIYAARRLSPIPTGRMAIPILHAPVTLSGAGYGDLLVEHGVAVIELASGRVLHAPDGFQAVGPIASATCPLWSDDSSRFSVASRRVHSTAFEGDVAYHFSLGEGGLDMTSVDGETPIDALTIAHLMVAESTLADAMARVERRPRMQLESGALVPLSMGGQVARSGGTVVVAAGGKIDLLSRSEAITLAAQAISPIHVLGRDTVGVLALHEGNPVRITVSVGGHEVTPATAAPEKAGLTWLRPGTGLQLWVQNADDGTRLLVETDDLGVARTSLERNRHFAEVRRPARREVRYPGRDRRERIGILYLPTSGARPADGWPVVVYAYPTQAPGLESALGGLNTASSWLVQPYLAAGFAVFHAAFPVEPSESPNAPMRLVMEAVMPALDALDADPDVARGRYGFYGHSNGGYTALALGAQTDRFRAIVASAPFPDVLELDLSASPDMRHLSCAPAVAQARRYIVEAPNLPFSYGRGFVQDRGTLVEQSPLYNMESYRTPTLLLYGENDGSLPAVEKMFLALQMAGVDAELQMFWGESHVLQGPDNIRFAAHRQVEWMQRFLRRV